MFKNTILFFLPLVTMWMASSAQADTSLVFICHKGMHYTRAEVGYTYKAFIDEPRPIDNRKLFNEMLKFIDYTPDRYDRVWSKMSFRRGLFTPKMAANDAEVVSWVAASSTGIGYVSAAPNNPYVEVCGEN